jgi:hypothetical protein
VLEVEAKYIAWSEQLGDFATKKSKRGAVFPRSNYARLTVASKP